jgi:transposase
MARAYSVDLRERLLQARDAGLAPVEIERTLGISRRTQRRWVQQRATTGTLVPGHSSGRRPKIAPAALPALQAQVLATPDATLAAHCAQWAISTGVTLSTATMSRYLRRLRLPLKKRA